MNLLDASGKLEIMPNPDIEDAEPRRVSNQEAYGPCLQGRFTNYSKACSFSSCSSGRMRIINWQQKPIPLLQAHLSLVNKSFLAL